VTITSRKLRPSKLKAVQEEARRAMEGDRAIQERVSGPGRLSPEEIEALREDARRDAAEFKAIRERQEAQRAEAAEADAIEAADLLAAMEARLAREKPK
jgi:hypothetical protein